MNVVAAHNPDTAHAGSGPVVSARGLRKAYKNKVAVAGADFRIGAGRIVGLIGPNGAGKTTALKAILGLTPFEGELRVREMSKGMIVQLHLALVMAIDARLLVLDEPTLGLDILYRKQFYQRLLEDYFDEDKTILVTTHQVEEIEHILTDVLFIRDGAIVLSAPMEDVAERYTEVLVNTDALEAARALGPIDERALPFGKTVLLFDGAPSGVTRAQLAALGETRNPGLADLFVATMKGTYA